MRGDENTLKTRYINISEDMYDLVDIVSNLEGPRHPYSDKE